MKNISGLIIAGIAALFLNACEEIQSYPETPQVEYKSFGLFSSVDPLGNQILVGQLEFDFTDGDGNVGLKPDSVTNVPDSLKYNLFLSLYNKEGNDFEKIEDLPSLNYRVPYIEREGQNKTLKGTITVDLEYKTIEYDTIFYTFYITDREYNKSNVDSTEVLIFTGLEFEDTDDFR
jgi:hypothetical protein